MNRTRQPSPLTDKVVAITGGARGIGEATARAAARAGARVVVGDLEADVAAGSAAAYGGLGLHLDVTSAESHRTFLDRVEAEHGRVDAYVNNAGIMVIGRLLEADLDRQLRQLDVNLRGVVLGCHEAASRMAARGGGRIVNIASLAGAIPNPGTAVYSATKSGVIALSEALDAELAPRGIRVGAVLPSFASTRLIAGTTAPAISRPVTPEVIADVVVDMIGSDRAVATAPGWMSFARLQWALLTTGGKQRMRRWTGTGTAFTDFDHDARAEYEKLT